MKTYKVVVPKNRINRPHVVVSGLKIMGFWNTHPRIAVHTSATVTAQKRVQAPCSVSTRILAAPSARKSARAGVVAGAQLKAAAFLKLSLTSLHAIKPQFVAIISERKALRENSAITLAADARLGASKSVGAVGARVGVELSATPTFATYRTLRDVAPIDIADWNDAPLSLTDIA
jgi:hypothetical protein